MFTSIERVVKDKVIMCDCCSSKWNVLDSLKEAINALKEKKAWYIEVQETVNGETNVRALCHTCHQKIIDRWYFTDRPFSLVND